MKRLLYIVALLPLIASMVVSNHISAYAFDSNDIIDDSVYNNFNSMSAAQIDSFLNGFTSSCISPNSGFRAEDPTGYNPTSGFLYDGYVTAGQVIADASQAYNLNPQVLLTTLEKEQSLITGQNNFGGFCNSSDQNKYTAAVGYGCPDSGTTYNYTGLNLYQRNGVTMSSTGSTCVNTASKAGFTQQIIRAAWLLKFGQQRSWGNIGWAIVKGNWNNSDDPQSCYGGPTMQGTFAVCPSSAATYHDGYYTIDSTSVHINSGATAALYWYTPHFSGNQHFYSIFTQWFGSAKAVSLPGCVEATNTTRACVWYLTSSSGQPFLTSSLTLRQELVDNEDVAFFGNVICLPYNIPVYLLGAPNGSSFLTTNYAERSALITSGYTDHGIDFYADPSWSNTGYPVTRLYNSTTSQRVWTADQQQKQSFQQAGYSDEGVAFTSISSVRQENALQQGELLVYRFYIPQTFSHFWTTDVNERDNMIRAGYLYEGVAWSSPANTSYMPVYRLYAPSIEQHLYTTDVSEKNNLVASGGWNYEGISEYANLTATSKPVYRVYAPSLGIHLYTADANERNVLVASSKWKDENVAWYEP
jgi:hypothetical protein